MNQSAIALPKPGLRSAVQSFWQVVCNNETPVAETILPTGVIEIIFNLNHVPIYSQVGGKLYRLPRCFVNGYNTQPIAQQIPRNQAFFGIILQATASKSLFGITADAFVDCCTDMTLVDSTFNSLWHQLAAQPAFAGRVQLVSDALTNRLMSISKQEEAFNHFINSHANSTLSVSQVADLLCYSPRQLSRKLQVLTGLNTEETLLYKKYLHALELVHHTPLSLTQIAYNCQFSDQSHFNKTFKSFTSLTPTDYRTRKSQVVGHILENVR